MSRPGVRFSRVDLVLWCLSLGILAACASVPTPTPAGPEVPSAAVQSAVTDEPKGLPAKEQAEAGDAPSEGPPDETVEQREARLAAEAREREEAEQRAQEEARKAAEEKRRIAEEKLTAQFKDIFDGAAATPGFDPLPKFEELAGSEPESSAAHYNRAVLLERRSDRAGAAQAYRRALELRPDYEQASDNLSRLYLRMGEVDRAEKDLRERVFRFPKALAFKNQLARVLVAAGRVADAEAELKRVLKTDEVNVEARVNLASIFLRQKKFELAKQVLDQAKDIDGSDPAVWNLLGFCQLGLDQKPLAIDSFRKAAELREDFPEAHVNLGALLNEVNDCDGALRELELAVRYAPDSAPARLNLGNAYRCGRRYPEAQTQYEWALHLDPQGADPYFNLAILYLDGDIEGLDKLARLRKSTEYFELYKKSGGDDSRFARYFDESRKAISKETDRLERVRQQEAKAREKAEKKRLAEEKARADAEARRKEIERLKLGHLDDVEDPPPADPTPAAAPAPARPASPWDNWHPDKIGPRDDIDGSAASSPTSP